MSEDWFKYKTEDSIVAFIDVLGSSDEIGKDVDASLNYVHEAYDSAIETCKVVFKTKIESLKIKIFSDNIVISIQCNSENICDNFYSVVVLCGLIQERFLQYKLLSRGGIAYGKYFVDDTMIWGTALVDAYKLEASVAIYPRIIVHPSLIAQVKHITGSPKSTFQKNFSSWLYQDRDGLFYVDYFNNFKYMKNPLYLLTTFLDDNEDRLAENLENVKVAQKILWHNDYLNRKMSEYEPEQEKGK